jgi:hypothetical protein
LKIARVTLTKGSGLASTLVVGGARLSVCNEVLHDETINCPNDLIGSLRPLLACKGPGTLRSAFVIRGGLGGEQMLESLGNLGVLEVCRSRCMELGKISQKKIGTWLKLTRMRA